MLLFEKRPRPLRRTLHRRFAQAKAGQLVQGSIRRFSETLLDSRQTHHLARAGRQPMTGRAQRLVPRVMSLAATAAVIVMTLQLHPPQQGGHSLIAITHATGRLASRRFSTYFSAAYPNMGF